MAAELTVVVVHRNRPDALVATVRSLRSGWSGPLRIVVVDNGSTGRLDTGGFELVRTGANLGFGAGANVGLRLARTPWVAVCPHDVEVAEGALDRMVAVAAARPRAGLAGADLGLDEVPVVDPYLGGMSVPAVRSGDWAPAGYPHGTLLVARQACLDEVGLFDEAFFAYCEEADLALRARGRGWLSGQVWGADARNTGLASVGVSDYLKTRNTLHLVRRWFGCYRAGVRVGLEVPDALRSRPIRLAVRDFVAGRWGPPPPGLSTDEAQAELPRQATSVDDAGGGRRDDRPGP